MKSLVAALLLFSVNAFAANPHIIIKTNKGVMEAELFEDKAPISVKNFMSYVNKGFYKNMIFHRVIDGFMIQGGGFDKDMNQKTPSAPIKNEATNGLKNEMGTLAMARTGVVDSATSQFFINVSNNDFLNNRDTTAMGYGYAVFGKITKGMPVVNMIKSVKTTSKSGHQDVPVEAVVILDITKK